MENFETAISATETAYKSAGSAERENERYMESLEAKTQALKTAFQQLVLGDGGLTNFAKGLVDAGTAILKFLDTPLGQAIIKIGEMAAIVGVLNIVLGSQFVTAIGSAIASMGVFNTIVGMMIAQFGIGQTVTALFTTSIEMLTAAIEANPIGAVIIGITALIAVVTLATKAYKKWENGIRDASDALKNTTQEIDTVSSKIQSLEQQLETLQNKKVKLTDEDDILNLEKQERSLEHQLAIEKQLLETKQKEAKAEAEKMLKKEGRGTVTPENATYAGYGTTWSNQSTGQITGTSQEQLEAQVKSLQSLNIEIDNANAKLSDYKNQLDLLGVTEQQLTMTETQLKDTKNGLNQETINLILGYQQTLSELNNLNSTFDAVSGSAAENADVLQQAVDAGVDNSNVLNELIDAYIDVADSADEASDKIEGAGEASDEEAEAISNLAEKYNVAVDAIYELLDANEDYQNGNIDFQTALSQAEAQISENAQSTETLADRYKEVLSDIDGLSDAYATLTNAVAEYNANGEFSIETATNLLKLEPQYLALLQEENGQLSLNKAGYDTLVDAKIAEAKATVYAQAQDQAHEIVLADLARQAQGTASTVQQQANGVSNAANTINSAGDVALNGAMKFSQAWNLITKNGGIYSGLTGVGISEMVELQRQTRSQIKTLESLGTSIKNVGTAATTAGNKASGAGKRASGAAKSAAKSTKDAADLLNEYIVYKTEQWIKKVEKKVEDYKTQLKGLERQLERVKNKYEPLIEKNKEWMSTLSSNFDIVEKIENTGNKQLNKLLKELQKVTVEYDKQKKVLERTMDLRKEQIDDLDEQIDVYKELEDETKDYYKELLDDLEDANDELERQIKLEQLLDALNKAQSKRVKTYVEGQGFVYTQDSAAVSKATKDLQEFERSEAQKAEKKSIEDERDAILKQYEDEKKELEKQKKELEKLNKADEKTLNTLEREFNDTKDALNERAQQLYDEIYANNKVVEKQYKEEVKPINRKIKKLNRLIEQNQAKIDSAKKSLEDYKNQTHKDFSDLSDAQKKRGNTIISHLKDIASKMAVQEKKEQQKDKDAEKEGKEKIKDAGNTTTKITSEDIKSGTTKAKEIIGKSASNSESSLSKAATTLSAMNEVSKSLSSKIAEAMHKNKKAKGDTYISQNGMYLVGDNPNQNELVIGSRLNGAVGVNLNQGSGVVPHTLTSALMDMAEEYQRGNSNGVLNGTTNNNKSTSISIGNISLPNVQDGNAFVDYLQNFSLDMTQAAYSRT